VTVLLESAEDIPLRPDFDVVIGQLHSASGSLGQFEVRIDALQMVQPGGRGAPQLTPSRDGGRSACDLILDLRNETPLFHQKRRRAEVGGEHHLSGGPCRGAGVHGV